MVNCTGEHCAVQTNNANPSSHSYCILFLVTSHKLSDTHRPREIRRSIHRRWDICTPLLVEPPYLRTPAFSSKTERHTMHTSENRRMPSFHILWNHPLLFFLHRPCFALLSYTPLLTPQAIFSIIPGRATSTYWARGENNLSSTSAPCPP